MVDYDTKLGEWFKQVEKKAEELRARKAVNSEQDQTPVAVPKQESASEHVEQTARVEPQTAQQVEEAEHRETAGSVATAEMVGEPVEAPRDKDEPSVRLPGLFEEVDSSPVEDFLSFLSHTEEKTRKAAEEPFDHLIPSDKSISNLSEGTGEPRPIIPTKEPEPAPAAEIVVQASAPALTPTDVKPVEVTPPPAPRSSAQVPKQHVEYTRFPQQLQHLLQSAQDEVAQNSYKAFKESRAGLIERLLDPPVTLEEAARILNVCPTTVRRYTNRGILKHFRTAGNQRRFRLSDVLAFMESQFGRVGSAADETL